MGRFIGRFVVSCATKKPPVTISNVNGRQHPEHFLNSTGKHSNVSPPETAFFPNVNPPSHKSPQKMKTKTQNSISIRANNRHRPFPEMRVQLGHIYRKPSACCRCSSVDDDCRCYCYGRKKSSVTFRKSQIWLENKISTSRKKESNV